MTLPMQTLELQWTLPGQLPPSAGHWACWGETMFVQIKQQARIAVTLFSWMNMNVGHQLISYWPGVHLWLSWGRSSWPCWTHMQWQHLQWCHRHELYLSTSTRSEHSLLQLSLCPCLQFTHDKSFESHDKSDVLNTHTHTAKLHAPVSYEWLNHLQMSQQKWRSRWSMTTHAYTCPGVPHRYLWSLGTTLFLF